MAVKAPTAARDEPSATASASAERGSPGLVSSDRNAGIDQRTRRLTALGAITDYRAATSSGSNVPQPDGRRDRQEPSVSLVSRH